MQVTMETSGMNDTLFRRSRSTVAIARICVPR